MGLFKTSTLRLKLKRRLNDSYDVVIQPGVFQTIPEDLQKMALADRYCIITDTHLRSVYGDELAQRMRDLGLETTLISFQAGEGRKRLDTVDKLATQMVQLGHHRNSLVINLGGGVVGDLGGLVASLYMRGIPFIHVPTSLLAMADSSVGGKTGVNLVNGKNLMGTFNQPKKVYIDPQMLSTLSKKQIRNGLAEILKHGLLRSKKILKLLKKFPEKALDAHTVTMQELLFESARVKAWVVENDERESWFRMLLNYGHSIGHAIEQASGYRLGHGEAISIGMNLENKIAVERNLMHPKHQQRIEALLQSLKLPTHIPPGIDRKPILEALKHDKKNQEDDRYIFVLLKKPLRPVIVRDVTEEEVKAVL